MVLDEVKVVKWLTLFVDIILTYILTIVQGPQNTFLECIMKQPEAKGLALCCRRSRTD